MILVHYLPHLAIFVMSLALFAAVAYDVHVNYSILLLGDFLFCMYLTFMQALPIIMIYFVAISVLAFFTIPD